ncbi:ThuA domain-containing protein [Novosphingobium tardum]|uniref:ThuA domain-containing protein n=1 Tax=Novosphingobium tardum TaxID=1538021 RepID=A0ABV8RU21_9SPHN
MPTIDYNAELNVVVAVRGHPFDRNALASMFEAMERIAFTFVDQPLAARIMDPDLLDGFDALCLYDMPGIDFSATEDRPRHVAPDPRIVAGFERLLEAGKGIVALHHALAGWPAWPEYAEALGGRFLYKPGSLRGSGRPDSGYRHNVKYDAVVLDPAHPVMAGIPPRFAMEDELYLAEVFEDSIVPLLRADHNFVAENFHSTSAAMEGRMFTNEGWNHADGSDCIGWVKRAGNSPLVYLQPGDDHLTYDNPVYRRLVENAVRWVASPAAHAWARAG